MLSFMNSGARASQVVWSATPTPFLTSEWDHGYRAERIRQLLEQVPDGGFTSGMQFGMIDLDGMLQKAISA